MSSTLLSMGSLNISPNYLINNHVIALIVLSSFLNVTNIYFSIVLYKILIATMWGGKKTYTILHTKTTIKGRN